MKFFITAIVILIITGVLCALGTTESVKRIDTMLETLNEAEAYDGQVPDNAAEAAEKFGKQWDKNMFLISMLLPHHHLDEVKEKLVALKAYADTEEFAEWQEANLILKEEMEHIRGLVDISADNIL